MITTKEVEEMRAVARRLAALHLEVEPAVERVYWFPAAGEIRLVEVDPTTFAGDSIEPFYFKPFPEGGVPFWSGVAVIRPEEKERLQPPLDWGRWEDAEMIWEKK